MSHAAVGRRGQGGAYNIHHWPNGLSGAAALAISASAVLDDLDAPGGVVCMAYHALTMPLHPRVCSNPSFYAHPHHNNTPQGLFIRVALCREGKRKAGPPHPTNIIIIDPKPHNPYTLPAHNPRRDNDGLGPFPVLRCCGGGRGRQPGPAA